MFSIQAENICILYFHFLSLIFTNLHKDTLNGQIMNIPKMIITERFLALLCYIAAPAQTIN